MKFFTAENGSVKQQVLQRGGGPLWKEVQVKVSVRAGERRQWLQLSSKGTREETFPLGKNRYLLPNILGMRNQGKFLYGN